jgi:hypothetical protein
MFSKQFYKKRPTNKFFQPWFLTMSFKPINPNGRPKRPFNLCSSCKSDVIHEAQLECSCPYINPTDSDEEDDFVKVARLEPTTRQPLHDPPDCLEDHEDVSAPQNVSVNYCVVGSQSDDGDVESSGEQSNVETSSQEESSGKEILTQVTENESEEEDLTQEVYSVTSS